MSEISRRNFLKGAAVAGAAVAGSAALAGCSSGGSAASGDWMPKSWDYETDVVVVGYGGAGMWSSLVAADEGGSEVVILEKAPVEGGGNSRINNGEWTVIKDPKLFREYCVAFGHGLIEEDMIDAYIGEATKHTDYADKYGMTYEVAEKALAGTIPEYWFLDDGKYAGCIGVSNVEGFGMTTFHELEAKRAELGLPIEIKFKCTEEHLVQNPDTKEIVGVRFLEDGTEKTIKARKGVVLCTGGFEFNEELKNTYLSIYPFKFEGWRFNTGDGIRMVEEVGAKLWHMNMVISTTAMWTRDPEYDFAIFAGPQSNAFFTVNRLGKRYQNENKTGGTAHNGWHTLMSFNDDDVGLVVPRRRHPVGCSRGARARTARRATSQGSRAGQGGTGEGSAFQEVATRQSFTHEFLLACERVHDDRRSPRRRPPPCWTTRFAMLGILRARA